MAKDKDEDLRQKIMMGTAQGELTQDEGLAMLSVLNGAPLLRPVTSAADQATGRTTIYETLDSDGDLLVAGQNYTFEGEKVRILRERAGAGNILDVYMRVFYLDRSLEKVYCCSRQIYSRNIWRS